MASNETPRSRKSSAAAAPRPPEKDVKCPRCDSPNTKFCYYNNYSLTQPRHFCKTCRRYWTKGGALRNVPVGGGCRRNKKTKSSSSSSISLSMDPYDPITSSNGCLKFLTGLSPSPVTDFHLSLSRFQYSPSFASNCPSAIGFYNHEMGGPSGNGNDSHSSLACTIESLSSINQDMHLKLQQQRMESMLFGDHGSQKAQPFLCDQQEPMSYHGAESSRADSIAWFLGGSCAVNPDMINGSGVGNNDMVDGDNNGNWNGIPAWTDVHHYPALP